MFELLNKFDIPDRPLNAIENYTRILRLKVVLTMYKLVDYTTGVKQRDNFAPILFIIGMQFLTKLLEK